ncbi:HNH endonuclease [Jannaschia formosa]|uniref:HNH endonuclease n=1 Tax=Jannaschia formosa TaxID=2259592 RepID=UPI001FD7C010|nr:HNH endonuclease [Jannaschia formosa]
MLRECVGDWVVFYEGRAGLNGYTHVQKVAGVRPDPKRPDHFYADLDPAEMLQFERRVSRLRPDGTPYEQRLPPSGGLNASAVRRLTPREFSAIVSEGLHELPDIDAHPRSGPLFDLEEDQSAFTIDRTKVLTSRTLRDAAFSRMVRRAYGGRCAISGLSIRNGGGRAEVQAAHIRPVAHGGPDVVRNGLALSGTLHWMFDRGLIAIAEDHAIMVSHNKVDIATVDRLLHPSRRLMLPKDPRDHPHPEYLRYHREEVYGHA